MASAYSDDPASDHPPQSSQDAEEQVAGSYRPSYGQPPSQHQPCASSSSPFAWAALTGPLASIRDDTSRQSRHPIQLDHSRSYSSALGVARHATAPPYLDLFPSSSSSSASANLFTSQRTSHRSIAPFFSQDPSAAPSSSSTFRIGLVADDTGDFVGHPDSRSTSFASGASYEEDLVAGRGPDEGQESDDGLIDEGNEFASTAPYERRSRVPLDQRPHRCTRCPQSFTRAHDLKRHQSVHFIDRPFTCEPCGKSFARKDALRRHLIVKKCLGDEGEGALNTLRSEGRKKKKVSARSSDEGESTDRGRSGKKRRTRKRNISFSSEVEAAGLPSSHPVDEEQTQRRDSIPTPASVTSSLPSEAISTASAPSRLQSGGDFFLQDPQSFVRPTYQDPIDPDQESGQLFSPYGRSIVNSTTFGSYPPSTAHSLASRETASSLPSPSGLPSSISTDQYQPSPVVPHLYTRSWAPDSYPIRDLPPTSAPLISPSFSYADDQPSWLHSYPEARPSYSQPTTLDPLESPAGSSDLYYRVSSLSWTPSEPASRDLDSRHQQLARDLSSTSNASSSVQSRQIPVLYPDSYHSSPSYYPRSAPTSSTSASFFDDPTPSSSYPLASYPSSTRYSDAPLQNYVSHGQTRSRQDAMDEESDQPPGGSSYSGTSSRNLERRKDHSGEYP